MRRFLFLAGVLALAPTALASGGTSVSFCGNDPSIWYYPATVPLAAQSFSTGKPGSSLSISESVTSSVGWSSSVSANAGVSWGPVSAGITAQTGINVGSSSTTTVTSTITAPTTFSGTLTVYQAFQKKIFKFEQRVDSNGTRPGQTTKGMVCVFVPTGGVAKVWTNVSQNDGSFPPVSDIPICEVTYDPIAAPGDETNCHNPWINLGCPLSGVFGQPQLLSSGELAAGTPGGIFLENAWTSTPGLLALSFAEGSVPLFGGTLKAFPFAVPPLNIVTDANGESSLAWPAWPPGLPAGFELVFQYGIIDPGSPQGLAFSNAVKGVTP